MMKFIYYKFNKYKNNLLYICLRLIYPKKINKGDTIECFGVGYPHWKGEQFECTLDFNDGTIGIKNSIRVSSKDFKVVNK